MWIRRIDGDGPWEFAGEMLEPPRPVFKISRPAGPAPVLDVGLTLRLEPCLLCRATLIIVNGKIEGPASFRLDDGDVVIIPHADTCHGEHGR